MVEQHPVGTLLFFVPIRFWEDEPIDTGKVALHKGIVSGEVWDSFTHDGFVYAFHDGYGHNVYMSAEDVFLTMEEAIVERTKRRKIRKIEQKREMDAFMARVFGRTC